METYDCAVQREPQLKFIYILTNTTKYNQIQSTSTSHANNIQKHHKPQKQTKIHLQALPCTNWFQIGAYLVPIGSYGVL